MGKKKRKQLKKSKVERIDRKYLINQINDVFQLDSGFLFTIKALLTRPVFHLKRYLHEERTRYTRPFVFLLFISLLANIVFFLVETEDNLLVSISTDVENSSLDSLFFWLDNNYGYFNLFNIFFIAFWIRILFLKKGYNFYEIIVMLCYIMSINIIFFVIASLIGNCFSEIMGVSISLSFLLMLLYTCFIVSGIYGKRKIINYIKVSIAILLGIISFWACLILVGVTIDSLELLMKGNY